MKKTLQIIGLILLIGLTSCITQSKCEKRYPTKDSTSVVFKHKIINIHDTAWFPSANISFDTMSIGLPENIVFNHTEKRGHLTSTVSINKGKLSFNCKADSLQHIIDSLVIVTDTSVFKSEKSKPQTIKENEWWVTPLVCAFISLLIILIIVLAGRGILGWIKSIFKI